VSEARTFALGDFPLACGAVARSARLVYRCYGTLAPDRSNVVLYPTSYGAQHTDVDWLIDRDRVLDPSRYFVVVPNMFGNGLSSSPSNLPDPEVGLEFTHDDNVRAQRRLLRDELGIERLALVYGWSMGAQQAYHWAVRHPEQVDRVVAVCGTARTTPHNLVFLESLEAALTADPAWDGRGFRATPDRGYRAFARVYASWAASQAFYKAELFRAQGYDSLEDYLDRGWEASYRRRDPLDLVAMLRTWKRNDVASDGVHGGDLASALGSIRARTIVVAASTDLYFTAADCAEEAAAIPGAELRIIRSVWGHRAGNPVHSADDASFLRGVVRDALALPAPFS
jgi:homoserine O-acetyltransferase